MGFKRRVMVVSHSSDVVPNGGLWGQNPSIIRVPEGWYMLRGVGGVKRTVVVAKSPSVSHSNEGGCGQRLQSPRLAFEPRLCHSIALVQLRSGGGVGGNMKGTHAVATETFRHIGGW